MTGWKRRLGNTGITIMRIGSVRRGIWVLMVQVRMMMNVHVRGRLIHGGIVVGRGGDGVHCTLRNARQAGSAGTTGTVQVDGMLGGRAQCTSGCQVDLPG